jgi:hypothetical protein
MTNSPHEVCKLRARLTPSLSLDVSTCSLLTQVKAAFEAGVSPKLQKGSQFTMSISREWVAHSHG